MDIIDKLKEKQRDCDHDYVKIGKEKQDLIHLEETKIAYKTPWLCTKCLHFDILSWS